MKRYISYIIVVAVVAGTFLLFRYNKQYALQPYNKEWVKDSIDFNSLNYKINVESMGMSIPDDVMLHTGDSLLNWVKRLQRPILVFRFCEDHCGMCIDNELYMLKQYMDDCVSNIVFFTSYSQDLFPKISTIKKMRCLAYNVNRDAFNWIVESYNAPYYFVLYPDGKAGNFYLPDKAYPSAGKNYLMGVRNIIL